MDVSQCPMDSSADMRIWERQLLYCVLVPELKPWTQVSAKEFGNQSMDWTLEHGEKRRREDDESSDMPVSSDEVQNSPNTKRRREGEHSSLASHSHGAATEIGSSGTSLVSGLDSNSPPCLVQVPCLHCFVHRKLAVQGFLQNNSIVEMSHQCLPVYNHYVLYTFFWAMMMWLLISCCCIFYPRCMLE
ncbi:Mini-chromosome maintenance complex-binding protein [Spatholobus suberectus]|nr:Mini-chromosome maintenance complex-binding protein [Spatholobus suberectus]